MYSITGTPRSKRYIDPHSSFEHVTTPKRVKIQENYDFIRRTRTTYRPLHLSPRHNILYPTAQIFRDHGVPPRTGYRILADPDPRRLNNSLYSPETRGRKKVISSELLKEIEKLIVNNGTDGRLLDFYDIKDHFGLICHPRTIENYLGTLNFHRCIACRTSWVSPETAGRRKEYAEYMLEKYPKPEDWWRVRFSDEVHFGYGPEGEIKILRRPGERLCPDCIIEKKDPDERDIKRIHAWAAIGHNFKSELYFYNTGRNTNGKMDHKTYVQILEAVVKPWVDRGDDFVLEEDGDSGHGYPPPIRRPKLGCLTRKEHEKRLREQARPIQPKEKKDNIVVEAKKRWGIESYKNCSSSPDLVPIENAWAVPKREIRKYPHWDEEEVKRLACEGWEKLSFAQINHWVDEIPRRLKNVIDLDGQMSGY